MTIEELIDIIESATDEQKYELCKSILALPTKPVWSPWPETLESRIDEAIDGVRALSEETD